MHKHRSTVWLLLVALVFPVSPGVADEPKDVEDQSIRAVGGLTFIDEIELTIASLVVHVTDKKGNAITDLGQDDFEIFHDGERREITNFRLYTDESIRQHYAEQEDLGTPALTQSTDTPAGPVPIHMVLYIDNENLEPLDRNRVLSQAKDFVRTSVHPPAQMMVVAYQRSFEVLQEFTSDPNEVLDAIRSVRRYTGGRSERQNARRDIISKMNELEGQANSGGGSYSNQSGSRGGGYSQILSMIANYAREVENSLFFTLDQLRQIITSLSGLPGKKGIIYVSNGLPMIPGMDLYYELSRVTHESTVLSEMYQFDRSRLYQQLAATANSQGVTLYTINASGLDVGGGGSAEYSSATDPLSTSIAQNNLNDSLRFLADETGGMAIYNTNDVGPKLGLISQDMYTYYSLGYPLQASGSDRVHKVKVKLRDNPAYEKYQLRYRSRFVEKSLETRVQDAVVSSLVFDVVDNPMELDVVTGTPVPASEGRWILPTEISFPINKVALLPEGEDYVARVVFYVATRDSEGKRSDLVQQNHEVRVPSTEYERAQRERFTIKVSLLMEAGRYKVAVALLDPVTRQDSYRTISTAVNPKKK